MFLSRLAQSPPSTYSITMHRCFRVSNEQYIETTMGDDPVAELRPIGGPEVVFEYLLNTVRLQDDISAKEFAARTGQPADTLHARLQQPVAAGLMEATSDETWRVTALGRSFLNDLQAEFLPE